MAALGAAIFRFRDIEATQLAVPGCSEGRKACRLARWADETKQPKQRQWIAPKSEAKNLPRDPNPKPKSPKSPHRERGVRPVGGAACHTGRAPPIEATQATRATNAKERSQITAPGTITETIQPCSTRLMKAANPVNRYSFRERKTRSDLANTEIDHREIYRHDLSASLSCHSTSRSPGRSGVSAEPVNLQALRRLRTCGLSESARFQT
ncbi:hypothetical protein SCOR_19395 [Sulfidibacter corallicola]